MKRLNIIDCVEETAATTARTETIAEPFCLSCRAITLLTHGEAFRGEILNLRAKR